MTAPNDTGHGHDSNDESDPSLDLDPDCDLRSIGAINQELDTLRSFDRSNVKALDGGDGLFAVVTNTGAFLADRSSCFSIRGGGDDKQILDMAVTDVAVGVAGETVSRITPTGTRTHSTEIPGAQQVLYGPDDTYATIVCGPSENATWGQGQGRNQVQTETRLVYLDPETRLDQKYSISGHDIHIDLAEVCATASGGGWDAFLTESTLRCIEATGDASFSLDPEDLDLETPDFVDVSATAQRLVLATGQYLYWIDPAAGKWDRKSAPSLVGLSTPARNEVYAWTEPGKLFIISDEREISSVDAAATEVYPAADHSMYAVGDKERSTLDIRVRPPAPTIELDIPPIEFGESTTVDIIVRNPGPEPFTADAVLLMSGVTVSQVVAPEGRRGNEDPDSPIDEAGPCGRNQGGGGTSDTNTHDSDIRVDDETPAEDGAETTSQAKEQQIGTGEDDELVSDVDASVPVSFEIPPFTQRRISLATVTVPTPVETARFTLRGASDAGAGHSSHSDSDSITNNDTTVADTNDVIDERTVDVRYGEPSCQVTGSLEALGRESAEVALKVSNTGDGVMYVTLTDPAAGEEGESGTGDKTISRGETQTLTTELDIRTLREDPSVSIHYRSATPKAEWQTHKTTLETSIPKTPCTVGSISDAGGNGDGRPVRVDLRNPSDLTVSERVIVSRAGTQLRADVTMPPGEMTSIWALFPTGDTPPRVDPVTVHGANGLVEPVDKMLTPHDRLSVNRRLYDINNTAIENDTKAPLRGDRVRDRLSIHNQSTEPICDVTIAGAPDVTIDRVNPDERLEFERWVAVTDEDTTLPSVTVTHENQAFEIPQSLPFLDTPDVTCRGRIVDTGHGLVFVADLENHTDTTVLLREISLDGESCRMGDTESVRIGSDGTTRCKLTLTAENTPDAARAKSDQNIKTATVPLDITFEIDSNRRGGIRAEQQFVRRTLVPVVAAPPVKMRVEADDSGTSSGQDDQTQLVVHVENKGTEPVVLDVLVQEQGTEVTTAATLDDTEEPWSKSSRMTISDNSLLGIHNITPDRTLVRFDDYDIQYLIRPDEASESWTHEPMLSADSSMSTLLMTAWRREPEADNSE